jgi:hypothetical protein
MVYSLNEDILNKDTYEEFEAISVRIVKKLPQNVVILIASSVWKSGSRDIRDVLKIAKLCNQSDTEEDINRLVSLHQSIEKLVANITDNLSLQQISCIH